MNTLTLFVQQSLKGDLDYGKIPGCGDKPVLFKPGAEKIATLFGLHVSLERLEAIKDFTGKDFGGEPFFSFEYMATLKNRQGEVVAQCVGSCNSWEDKYRWRKAERSCPHCGAHAIKRSNYPDKQTGDKGWYCHNKLGGCNAKFKSDDPAITSQQAGRVPNERIFDQINTLDKMAQKRAFVGAVILGANASNYFAIEHAEINGVEVIDADYEPMQSVDSAQPVERIQVEVMPDDGRNDNQERIAYAIRLTEHKWSEAKRICNEKVAPIPSSEMSSDQVREVICWILTDYGVKRRRIHEETAYGLTTELINQQPNITDENLIDRFFVRLDELAHDAPVRSNGQAKQFAGVSID
ncbi:MAG: hypothetical protein AAGE59_38040 [Cyanobacteria bacterium P01_F01_bin.86]